MYLALHGALPFSFLWAARPGGGLWCHRRTQVQAIHVWLPRRARFGELMTCTNAARGKSFHSSTSVASPGLRPAPPWPRAPPPAWDRSRRSAVEPVAEGVGPAAGRACGSKAAPAAQGPGHNLLAVAAQLATVRRADRLSTAGTRLPPASGGPVRFREGLANDYALSGSRVCTPAP
jgi:hypothetical protein